MTTISRNTHKKARRKYTPEELYNPQIDLTREAFAYGRQSTKDQVVKNIQAHISQTVLLLDYTRTGLGFKDDGTTGKVTLFVENQVVDADGNVTIKNASGTWPIDRRPGLKTICDAIEHGIETETTVVDEQGIVRTKTIRKRVGVVIAEFVDRLFRDEDRIDSNIFIKICKENDCYVHISSKRMTYNFANPAHADLFRMEVQMAAAYIENHIRGTMLRRREQAMEQGLWAGGGRIPTGFLVDRNKKSPTYGKLLPYPPHAAIQEELYIRCIELRCDLDALYEELRQKPYVFPDFEAWVEPEIVARFGLKRAPGGVGYTISKRGLEPMLCNPANIGIRLYKKKVMYNSHKGTVSPDLFWPVYDHFRDVRPDGTPTGRVKLVRYTQKQTAATRRRPLLKPVSPNKGETIRYGQGYYHVRLVEHYDADRKHPLAVAADQLEGMIVDRFLEHIRETQIGDLHEIQTKHEQQRTKRLREITREIATIDEEVATLTANLAKLKIEQVIQHIENQIASLFERKQRLLAEQATIHDTTGEVLRTLEEELEELEELWPEKPFDLKHNLLAIIIKRVMLSYCSPRFFQVTIEWALGEWGTETCYYDRAFSGGKMWTKEEREILRTNFATMGQVELMQLLPARSWRSITTEAQTLHLHRRVFQKGPGALAISYLDLQFLTQANLRLSDFNIENHTQWT